MLRVRTALSGFDGGPGLSTFYFNVVAPDVAAVNTILDGVHQWWDVYGKSFIGTGVDIQVQSEVDVIDATTGATTDTISGHLVSLVNGNGGVALAPAASAALVSHRSTTFIKGRRVIGRTFLSPLAVAVVGADGKVTPALVETIPEGMVTLKGAVVGVGYPVIWHRPVHAVGGSMAPITTDVMPAKLAVLTSRRD